MIVNANHGRRNEVETCCKDVVVASFRLMHVTRGCDVWLTMRGGLSLHQRLSLGIFTRVISKVPFRHS